MAWHDAPVSDVVIRGMAVAEMDPATLYEVLALRAAVFVVEQDCAYLDPDGRDLERGAVQLWAERDGAVLAVLRMLDEPDGSVRIGRVSTAAGARGAGLAGRLVERAIALAGPRWVVLGAQAHLAEWYAQFGFARAGLDYDEDGIAHTPMHRPPRTE
jgi:ElaA protein